jgi:hypothetical protein
MTMEEQNKNKTKTKKKNKQNNKIRGKTERQITTKSEKNKI